MKRRAFMNRFVRILIVTLCLKTYSLYPMLLTLETFKTDEGVLKKEFVKTMKSLFRKNIFFETGTYGGNTTAIAVQIFDKVYSTELSKRMYRNAQKKFKKHKKVRIYHGNSPDLLNKKLSHISQDILFWLDAHYCGVGTARSNSDCPVIEELYAIKKRKKDNCVIMIDDLREFYSDSWPSIQEAIIALRGINPQYVIISFGDLLLAYPPAKNIHISDYLQACSISRFFDTHLFNYTVDDVLKAEEEIASLQGPERAIFEAYLDHNNINQHSDPYVLLWKGLLFEHSLEDNEAYAMLKMLLTQSHKHTINHWRINWYYARIAYKLNKFEEAKEVIITVLAHNPTFAPAHNMLNAINERLI